MYLMLNDWLLSVALPAQLATEKASLLRYLLCQRDKQESCVICGPRLESRSSSPLAEASANLLLTPGLSEASRTDLQRQIYQRKRDATYAT